MSELIIDLNAPALTESDRLGVETKKLGLDWQDLSQVIYKVEEEWQELKEELPPGATNLRRHRVEDEIGDLLFSVAQLARHLAIDPEAALAKSNAKYLRRVQSMEKMIHRDGKDWLDFTFEELEIYWERAKRE